MNPESSLFNPLDLDLSRSTFEFHPTRSGTMNAGRLVPILAFDVMPGDEFDFTNIESLIKMSTPVYPTMDKLYLDLFAFYVPNRLVLGRRYGTPDVNNSNESWAAIIGAQDNLVNMPIPEKGLEIPSVWFGASIKTGGLMDYFCLDTGYNFGGRLNCLPVLSYFAIWNENFRDPNLMQPVTWSFGTVGGNITRVVPYGDVQLYSTKTELSVVKSYTSGQDYQWYNALADANGNTSPAAENWLPFPVCRFHGYFGSALPWPQRNTDGVALPLGDMAPVLSTDQDHDVLRGGLTTAIKWVRTSDGSVPDTSRTLTAASGGRTVVDIGSEPTPGTSSFTISNLWTDLSQATAANVNALRAAIQKQRWYEKLARSGNRYDEFMYGTFGVRPHNSGDDRPKYIGGRRIPLSMTMVASTNGDTAASSGEGAGSLGALGAFSHTNDQGRLGHQGFDDWGTVMFLACIRHHDTYSSGVDKHWLRKTREDFYFPTFAHLGEQILEKRQLGGSSDAVLGYQEAWSEYRYMADRVCGLLRDGKNLDFMTYARSYSGSTSLVSFLNASPQVEEVDKTLAVDSNASGFQFVYQFTFNMRARRPMPTHSIPGLMDHF